MRACLTTILLLYIFTGCHKDQQIPLQPYPSDCSPNGFDSMPGKGGGVTIEPSIYFDSLYIRFPYTNPNNPDEIIYYQAYKQELIKYNIVTKEKQLLYKGLLLNRAKWSKKGWIILAVGGGQIWKIKEDGTQLTQLTFGTIIHSAPEWNYTGDKFICQANKSGYGYETIYSENGQAIDSINHYVVCWQSNEKALSFDNGVIGLLDVQKDIFTPIYDFQSNGLDIRDCYWMPDAINAILLADNGIYSINTQTKKLTFLKQSCPHTAYFSLCISHPSGKLIMEKPTAHYVGNNSILTQTKLVLMNSDGSGEVEIEL